MECIDIDMGPSGYLCVLYMCTVHGWSTSGLRVVYEWSTGYVYYLYVMHGLSMWSTRVVPGYS